MDFSHTLVVGGTGMLAAATRHLAARSSAITLVARHPDRLDGLEADHVERIAVDYHQTDALLEHLERAVRRRGEFDLALTWVHASAEASLRRIADLLTTQTQTARFVDVQGCAAVHPGGESERHRYLSGLDGLSYQRVILGFILESDGSRWLTDDEIAAGVINTVEIGEAELVVGVVEPWEHKP